MERRHAWQDWSKEFMMKWLAEDEVGVGKQGPVCPAKGFRRGQRATKGF